MTDQPHQEAMALADDGFVRLILDEVCRLTGMGFAAVARVTEDRWIACQVVDRIEFGLQPGDELEIKTTICGEIREHGRMVVIDHVGGDDAWRTHPVPILYGFESYIALPIVLADGSFFGTLCAIDPEPRTLSAPETIAVMQRMAVEIAGLVDRARGA